MTFKASTGLEFLDFSAQLLGLQGVEHDEHELTRLGLIQHHVSVNSARQREREGSEHKVLTYKENRAVSGVFQTIDPPPPSTQQVCPPLAPKAGGTHSPGGEGVGGQYFGRRQTLDWPLTV